jgi:DNA polymerase-3 subunit epsilon
VQSKYVIGHNLDFDERVVSAEFFRAKMDPYFDNKIKICTMKTSTDYCAIDGRYGYKWPKLSELYTKLFDEEILETHDAEKDMEVTQKCFWELKNRGVIKLLKS